MFYYAGISNPICSPVHWRYLTWPVLLPTNTSIWDWSGLSSLHWTKLTVRFPPPPPPPPLKTSRYGWLLSYFSRSFRCLSMFEYFPYCFTWLFYLFDDFTLVLMWMIINMDVLALFVFSCTLLNYSCVDRHVSLDSHWAISMIFVVRIPRWELVTQKKTTEVPGKRGYFSLKNRSINLLTSSHLIVWFLLYFFVHSNTNLLARLFSLAPFPNHPLSIISCVPLRCACVSTLTLLLPHPECNGTIKDGDFVTAKSINNYKACTIVEGNLEILKPSFDGWGTQSL